MINENTKMIDVIKTMSEKDKLRLAICLANSIMSTAGNDNRIVIRRAKQRSNDSDNMY